MEKRGIKVIKVNSSVVEWIRKRMDEKREWIHKVHSGELKYSKKQDGKIH